MTLQITRIVQLNADGELVVDMIELDRSDDIQEIVWTLDSESLPNASFVSSQPKPHTWLKNTPWDAFSPAFPSDDRRSLTMQAHHRGSRTHGEFPYLLQVRLGGSGFPTFAKTRGFDSGRPVSNPVIVNH